MTDATRITRARHVAWLCIPGGIVLAAALLLALAVAIAAWLSGLRVERPGWQQGLVVGGWQLWQDDCLSVSGDRARLAWQWPVSLQLDRVRLGSCPRSEPLRPAAPGWAPPFRLAIAELQGVPGLPSAAALTLSHHDGLWRVQVALPGQQLQADYRRATATWALTGSLQAAAWRKDLSGQVRVQGRGRWQGLQHDGEVTVSGSDLGLAARPERARAHASLIWQQLGWRVQLAVPDALPLPAGWRLSPGQVLTAAGNAAHVESLQAGLQLHGPQGRARLQVRGAPGGRAGDGELVLDQGDWSGRWPLRWDARQLTLLPARLQLPGGLRWQLLQPLTLPWARDLPGALVWQLGVRELTLESPQGQLSWQDGLPVWQGSVTLSGREQGMALSGQWQGKVGVEGASGPDLQLRLRAPDRDLAIRLPVNAVRAPHWPLEAELNGRWQGWPVQGTVTARRAGDLWQGRLQAGSRLIMATSGGELGLRGDWRQHADGSIELLSGARAELRRSLFGTVLLQPVTAQATTAIRWRDGTLSGRWQLAGEGATMPRQRVPTWRGELRLHGSRAMVDVQIPAWQSRAALTADWQRKPLQGTFTFDSPIHPDMGGALGLVLRQGTVSGSGRWRQADGWQADASLQLRDLGLDSGSTTLRGLDASVQGRYATDAWRLASSGPVRIATVAIGTDITDSRFELEGTPERWQIRDASANLLGGSLSAAVLSWPSSEWQTVTLRGLDLAQLVALEGKEAPPVRLGGRVGGTLPLRLGQRSLAIRDGVLRNEGVLTLQVPRSPAVQAMSQSNRAVQLAMDTLSDMRVSEFDARLDMADDGWLDARVKIRGDSVQPMQPPVVLNYSHRENVLQLLRSLRISDEISQQVIDRHGGNGVTQ